MPSTNAAEIINDDKNKLTDGQKEAHLKALATHETAHVIDFRTNNCLVYSIQGYYKEKFEELVPRGKGQSQADKLIKQFYVWLTDPWEYRDLDPMIAADRRYNESGITSADTENDNARASRIQESFAQLFLLSYYKIDGQQTLRTEMLDRLKNPTNPKRIKKLVDLKITGNKELQKAFDQAVPVMTSLIGKVDGLAQGRGI